MTAVGGVLVLATGLLYVRVSRSESAEVDPAALARAESEFRAKSSQQVARAPRPERASVEPSPAPRPLPRRVEPVEPPEPPRSPPRPLTLPSTRRQAVNRLYDRHRYPQARAAALELLEEQPADRRMLRVVVSASCIMYEPDVAREYFQKLPERDKNTMRIRCERYEVDNLD